MTKSQLEATLSEAVNTFEIEYLGRTAKHVKTIVANDLIIIRLYGFLSWSEQILAATDEGIDLVKKLKLVLFQSVQTYFLALIKEITSSDVINIYSDISITTGEKIILLTMSNELAD